MWKLEQYRVYKKLLLDGFKLMRYSTLILKKGRIKEQKHSLVEKRKINEKDHSEHSKRHCQDLDEDIVSIEPRQKIINQLFLDMQKNAPKQFINIAEVKKPDYCIFLSNNKSRCNYDLELDIW